MAKEIAPVETKIMQIFNAQSTEMIEFNKRLQTEPNPKDLQVHKQIKIKRKDSQGREYNVEYQYLPISFLEMKLDEMCGGLWNTKNFVYSYIANELVGSLELEYWHPVAQTWVSRIGAGSVQIQFKKDSDFTILQNKYQNTLTKDFPHLKAECFRNACLSIGKAFGRDLNREYIDTYDEYAMLDDETKNSRIEDAEAELIMPNSKINQIIKLVNEKNIDFKLMLGEIMPKFIDDINGKNKILEYIGATENAVLIKELQNKHYKPIMEYLK